MRWQCRDSDARTPTTTTRRPAWLSTPMEVTVLAATRGTRWQRLKRWASTWLNPTVRYRNHRSEYPWQIYDGGIIPSPLDPAEIVWTGSGTEDSPTEASSRISLVTLDEPLSSRFGTTGRSRESSTGVTASSTPLVQSTAHLGGSEFKPSGPTPTPVIVSSARDRWIAYSLASMDMMQSQLLAAQVAWRTQYAENSPEQKELDSRWQQIWTIVGIAATRQSYAHSQLRGE